MKEPFHYGVICWQAKKNISMHIMKAAFGRWQGKIYYGIVC